MNISTPLIINAQKDSKATMYQWLKKGDNG